MSDESENPLLKTWAEMATEELKNLRSLFEGNKTIINEMGETIKANKVALLRLHNEKDKILEELKKIESFKSSINESIRELKTKKKRKFPWKAFIACSFLVVFIILVTLYPHLFPNFL